MVVVVGVYVLQLSLPMHWTVHVSFVRDKQSISTLSHDSLPLQLTDTSWAASSETIKLAHEPICCILSMTKNHLYEIRLWILYYMNT